MNDTPRLPPGQRLTDDFPVLHYGGIPGFHKDTWTFRIFGLVEDEVTLSYEQFFNLARIKVDTDFHCVTGWSRFDNKWEGISCAAVCAQVRIKPEARFVLVHCEQGYTTNLAIDEFMDDGVVFANIHDGEELAPKHGGPLRLVVPKLYAWKSAKWVRGVEFLSENRKGFWERHGYHIHGDPWLEERYSSE